MCAVWDKIKKYGILIIWIILALFLTIILIFSFKYINKDATQINTYTKHLTLVLVCGVFVFGSLIALTCRFILNVNDKYITWISIVLIGIFVVIELIMLRMFYIIPITDAYISEDSAMSLLEGDISSIDEYYVYFERYGNNYFLVLIIKKLFSIMFKFGLNNPYMFLNIVNGISLFITLILFWMSAVLVVGKRKACIALLFFVLNPVFYGLTFWTYSLTLSMPIMLGITYLGLKLVHSKNSVLNALIGIGIGILTVCGYYLRPTAVFPFIALIIVGICHIKKNRLHIQKLSIVTVLCIVSVFFTASFIQNRIDLNTVNTEGNLPATHWIMMGLEGDGSFNSEDEQFSMSFSTTEEVQQANIQVIKERIKDLGLIGLIKLWLTKLGVTWADGTHGFMTWLKQDTLFTDLYTYMVDGKTDAIALYSQIYQIVLFLGALVICLNQIFKREWDAGTQLIGITVFGGIIFYLLWEAKSVYSVPFLPFIYILGAQGWCSLPYKRASSSKNIKIGYGTVSAIIVILTVMAGILQFSNYTKVSQTFTQYSVRMYGPQFCLQIKDCSLSDKEITQSFYTDKSFNTIYIKASELDSDLSTTYNITLRSDDNFIIERKMVNVNDISADGYIIMDFDTVIPLGKQQYTVTIDPVDPGTPDSIQWWYRRSNTMDNYEGILTLDGEEQQYDLYISVFEEYSAHYISAVHYIIIINILIVIEIVILGLTFDRLFTDRKLIGNEKKH